MQEEIFLQCTKVYIWHGSQSGSYSSVDSHQTRHLKSENVKYSVVHSVSAILIRKLKFEKAINDKERLKWATTSTILYRLDKVLTKMTNGQQTTGD
jgi:hypothetical protein